MNNHSTARAAEYKFLSGLTLDGNILDIGGSKNSGYHELLKGGHTFTVINISQDCNPDFIVDIEKSFPFGSNTFDHAICLNVLEHIYEFENAISETTRVVKKDGKIIIATPMMFHIHGSPDDYFRYTESALRRLVSKYGCDVEEIRPLGGGLFSLGFQCIRSGIPTTFLQILLQKLANSLDKSLNKFFTKYRKLSEKIPLGYFVVARNLKP